MTTEARKTYLIEEIAELVKGRLYGPRGTVIHSLCPVSEPRKDAIAFTRDTFPERLRGHLDSGIAALIVSGKADLSQLAPGDCVIQVKDTIAAISHIAPLFYQKPPVYQGVHPKADIDPAALIGKNVSIGAFSVIGAGAEIGDDCVLYSHVVIYPGAKVGARTVLHSGVTIREFSTVGDDSVIQNGSVIGGDGFGYYLGEDMQLKSVPQYGNVTLARGVEVGVNSCIDKGTIGATVIAENTKIDNICQIGHNVQIGSNSLICAVAGIAGSARIGDYVTIAGHVGIADGIQIADGCRVGGASAVTRHLLEKGDYLGYPAMKVGLWRRMTLLQYKLPEIVRKLGLKFETKNEE